MNRQEFNKKATHPLQTWEWGEFRREWGNQVVRFSFGQITIHKIPHTPFKIAVFVKGPKPDKKQLETLKKYAGENRIIFIKIEPNYIPKGKNDKTALLKLLKENNCKKGRRLFTPETFILDLTKSEDELLKSFSSKTRYNIRLAQRKGVTVKIDNSEKTFRKYLNLTFETARRQNFYAHNERYHKLMWKHLKPASIANLLKAEYKKEILTTWILFSWKNTLYYPYGASSDKYKNLMANNLIMWEAIKFGKIQGLEAFDLWGKEEGKGFSKFKEGYNPEVAKFIGTWDLVISPLYYIYRIAETFRWIFLKKLNPFK